MAAPGFNPFVIPAKAGIQGPEIRRSPWMPAFAGMTRREWGALILVFGITAAWHGMTR